MAVVRRGGRRATPRQLGTALAPARLDQVRALAHPLRLRLLELFAESPRTTKQAAGVMGQPTTRLYHHVAALERAGFVRLARTRQVRGATEKYYEVVPRTPSAVGASVLSTPAGRRDTAALAMLLFEEARRDLASALARGIPGDTGRFLAVRGVLRLTDAEQEKLRSTLLELLRGVSQRSHGPGGKTERRRWSLTISLAPADAADAPPRARRRR